MFQRVDVPEQGRDVPTPLASENGSNQLSDTVSADNDDGEAPRDDGKKKGSGDCVLHGVLR